MRHDPPPARPASARDPHAVRQLLRLDAEPPGGSIRRAAIRSLSFTRSSAAPVITVSPSARAATHASSGSSSIIAGIVVGTDRHAAESARRDRIGDRGFADTRRSAGLLGDRCPHGLERPHERDHALDSRSTSGSRIVPSAAIAAKAAKKEADDGSPGTVELERPEAVRWRQGHRRPASRAPRRPARTEHRSVWSRETRSDSTLTGTPATRAPQAAPRSSPARCSRRPATASCAAARR